MNESKEIDISKTILDTIKLLEEKLTTIKEVDENMYKEMRKKLDDIYEASKTKTLNAFETVNLLMKLQNETIVFLDERQTCLSLQVYNKPSKNPIKKFFEIIKNKFIELSQWRHNRTLVENPSVVKNNE